MRHPSLLAATALFLLPSAAQAQSRRVFRLGASPDAVAVDPLPATQAVASMLVENHYGASDDMGRIERRLEVLRLVRDAHARAGWETAEATLVRCVHLAEVVVGGGDLAAQTQAAAGIPGPAELAEMAERAAGLHAEWGDAAAADACRALAGFYRDRAEGREALPPVVIDQGTRGPGQPWTDDVRLTDEQVELRVEVLHYAQQVLAHAGDGAQAEQVGRMAHVGDLYLGDAADEQVLEAYGRVDMGAVVLGLMWAGDHADAAGHPGAASLCRRVARYYSERDGLDVGALRAASERPAALARVEARDLSQRSERVQVLELTLAAAAREGDAERVARVERILVLARLQLAMDHGQPMDQEAFSGAVQGLNQQVIVDEVAHARELYSGWDQPVQARDCERLVAFYEGRRTGAVPAPVAEEPAEAQPAEPVAVDPVAPTPAQEFDPTVKRQRARILHAAARTLERTGDLAGADLLDRTVRMARLQIEEADDAEIAAAAQGLTMQGIVDAVRAAAAGARTEGDRVAARRYVALAEFYEDRDGLASPSTPRQTGVDLRGLSGAEVDRLAEQAARAARVEELEARIHVLEAQLTEMHAKLQALRAKQR